jgi:serine protease inhibitor
MRKVVSILSLGLMAVFAMQCSQSTDPVEPQPKPKPIPMHLSASDSSLSGSANAFGFTLFQRVVQEQSADSNLFISPLSVSYSLGMAWNGSVGTTKDAMAATLEFGDLTDSAVNESYRHLTGQLTTTDPTVKIDIANSIWYRDDFPVEQGFIDVNREYFDAAVRGMDFGADWAADTIDTWVSNATQGKIPTIVDRPIDRSLVMFLINAVYFKACWTLPFDPNATHDESFRLRDGSQTTCSMMTLDTLFSYQHNDLFEAVNLSYGVGGFRMALLLPDSGHTTEEIIAQLSDQSWASLRQGFTESQLLFSLPKFRFSYEIKLNDILKAMGMEPAFDPDAADFTRINTDGGLYISFVKHKTFVQVDEQGTEAAAVTSTGIGRTSMPQMMTVNRPFVFVIYEEASGSILFMGRIMNPVWQD